MSDWSSSTTTLTPDLGLTVRTHLGLLDEATAASVLDVETSTLATWRGQGKGPDYVKLGKGVFYTTSSISAWVNGEMSRQRDMRKAA